MTLRRIMLVSAWLAGLYFLYWSLIFDPSQPPAAVLAAGCGLLLLGLLETRFHVKSGGNFFVFLMPIALLGAAAIALLAAPVLEEFDDNSTGSITLYGKPNDITDKIHVPISRIPPTPFFQENQICSLNLQELRMLIMYEWDAKQPQYRPSNACITLDKVGTDRFRVVGSCMEDHTLKLDNSERVLSMYRMVDDVNPIVPVGVVLRFNNSRDAVRMEKDNWYEVTGRLVIVPERGTYPFQEMTSSEQMMTAYLQVEELRKVEHPEQDVIGKNNDVPPYHPVDVKYAEE